MIQVRGCWKNNFFAEYIACHRQIKLVLMLWFVAWLGVEKVGILIQNTDVSFANEFGGWSWGGVWEAAEEFGQKGGHVVFIKV